MVFAPVMPSLKLPVILEQNHGGEPGVQDQHDANGPHQVGHMPYPFHQGPGYQRADAGSIAHQPGVNVAHAVLVVVGEGEGLQMLKSPLTQFPVYQHFHGGGQGAGHIVGACGGEYGEQIQQHKGEQGIENAQPDEMVQGVALEQGQHNVRHAAHQAKGHHNQNFGAHRAKIGENSADSKVGQMGMGGFLHYAVTS